MKKKKNSMLLCIITAGVTMNFLSCSHDNYAQNEVFSSLPTNISSKYIAPSGDTLFIDDEAFEVSTLRVLSDIYGSNASNCNVTDIRHIPTTTGYVASIEYITPKGVEANYIMTNIIFKFEGGKLELAEKVLKNRSRLKSTNSPVKIKSLVIIPIETSRVNINSNDGIFTYSCQGDAMMKYDIK